MTMEPGWLQIARNIVILQVASLDITLPNKLITRVLIRLHRCAGLSSSSMFTTNKARFSHDEVTIWLLTLLPVEDVERKHNGEKPYIYSEALEGGPSIPYPFNYFEKYPISLK